MTNLRLLCLLPLIGCAASTNDVVVTLAPDVVSSIDGTLAVHSVVLADRDPSPDKAVEISVDYTDRNGTAHAIAPINGKTDKKGVFDATITGLMWDGTGTVKVDVLSGGAGSSPLMVGGQPVEADETFAVLDRTPPKVVITPPASNQIHLNTDATIMVHVSDEIGISQVTFETSAIAGGGGGGNGGFRNRSTVVASGATDATIPFDVQVADTATLGQTVTFYALAADLSGNEAAAMPVSVTVVQ